MKRFYKNDLIEILDNNNSKSMTNSNRICKHFLNLVNSDFSCEIEYNEKNDSINRGSLIECVIKHLLGLDSARENKNNCDIKSLKAVLGGRVNNLEIKYSVRESYASANKCKSKYVLLVNEYGLFLLDRKNILTNAKGRVINNQIGFYVECELIDKIRDIIRYNGIKHY